MSAVFKENWCFTFHEVPRLSECNRSLYQGLLGRFTEVLDSEFKETTKLHQRSEKVLDRHQNTKEEADQLLLEKSLEQGSQWQQLMPLGL